MYGGTRSTRTAKIHSAIRTMSPMPAMIEPFTAWRLPWGGGGAASSTALCIAASGFKSVRSITSTGETAERIVVLVIGRSFLCIQQTADFARELGVARMAYDGVEAPRPRNRHMQIRQNASGPRRHDDDSIAEKDRLRNAVRDEHDGLAVRLPDALQLDVHALAGERIERPEWLVHQQDLRIARQRTADAGALLHPAGQLVRITPAEFIEPRHFEQTIDACIGGFVTTADAQRQAHVLAHSEPRQKIRRLEHDAHLARRSRHRLVVERKLAGIVRVETGQHPPQRALADPGGSDDAHEFAFRNLHIDPVERMNVTARCGDVGLAHILDIDERPRALRVAIV